MNDRGGRRYSALVEFAGRVFIVKGIRTWDVARAHELMEGRREAFFKLHQVPEFQKKTWRVLGVFYGTIRFATE